MLPNVRLSTGEREGGTVKEEGLLSYLTYEPMDFTTKIPASPIREKLPNMCYLLYYGVST